MTRISNRTKNAWNIRVIDIGVLFPAECSVGRAIVYKLDVSNLLVNCEREIHRRRCPAPQRTFKAKLNTLFPRETRDRRKKRRHTNRRFVLRSFPSGIQSVRIPENTSDRGLFTEPPFKREPVPATNAQRDFPFLIHPQIIPQIAFIYLHLSWSH